MNVSFENLGAIRKADLDLSKKLTVFCGPNGTGKTYVCYAIYGYLEPLLIGFPLFKLDDLLKEKSIDIELNYQELYKWRTEYFKYLTKRIKDVFGVGSVGYFDSFKSGDLLTEDQYTASLREREFEFDYTYDNVSITYKK
jgi:predicted ATPase